MDETNALDIVNLITDIPVFVAVVVWLHVRFSKQLLETVELLLKRCDDRQDHLDNLHRELLREYSLFVGNHLPKVDN